MGAFFVTILPAFIISRVMCWLFVYMGHTQREFLASVPGGWEGIKNWWLNPWTTYDSKWFMEIASSGYTEQTTPFFPLYPLILKTGGDSETAAALTGFLVSNASFLGALMLVYLLTKRDFNDVTASRAVWFLAFFPTTAFFSAVYTESLFLMSLTGSFYLARRGCWLGAGCAGLLASLTRNPGFLISLALAIEYLQSTRSVVNRPGIAGAAGVLMPAAGFAAVQAYFWYKFGSPLSGVTSQDFYHRALAWPWEPVVKDLTNIFNLRAVEPVTVLNVVTVILVFVFAFKYRSCLRPSYAVLLLGVILMHLTYARTIPPHTIGAIRYMSTIFPFVQLFSISVSQLSRYARLVAATAYLLVFVVFSYYFGLKIFLG